MKRKEVKTDLLSIIKLKWEASMNIRDIKKLLTSKEIANMYFGSGRNNEMVTKARGNTFILVVFCSFMLYSTTCVGAEVTSKAGKIAEKVLKYGDLGTLWDIGNNTYKLHKGKINKEEYLKQSSPILVGYGASVIVTKLGIPRVVGRTVGSFVGASIGGFFFGPPGAVVGAKVGGWVTWATENFIVPNVIYYGGKFATEIGVSMYEQGNTN